MQIAAQFCVPSSLARLGGILRVGQCGCAVSLGVGAWISSAMAGFFVA